MIEKTDNSNSLNELSLCRHRTVSGRRCPLRVLIPESHLCFRHAQLREKKRDADELACDLAGQLTEFTSAADINSFLSRLLLLEAHDRIVPRRAACIAHFADDRAGSFTLGEGYFRQEKKDRSDKNKYQESRARHGC